MTCLRAFVVVEFDVETVLSEDIEMLGDKVAETFVSWGFDSEVFSTTDESISW